MDPNEHENDSDATYCSEAEDATFSEANLHTLFETIHNKISLHIKKQEFFNKPSIQYYLSVLGTIDNQDSSVKLAIEELVKKLQSILNSINNYEELISKTRSSSIFSNITQDQADFQPIRTSPISTDKDFCSDTGKSEINDLNQTDHSEIQDCSDTGKSEINDLNQTDHSEIQDYPDQDISVVADSFSEYKGASCSYKDVSSNCTKYENVSKKRKVDDCEIEDLKSVNCVFANREEKIEFLQRRKYVLEAMQKSTVPDISEAKGYIFEDPVIAKAYLDRLNSLIDSFRTSFTENIAKLVDEKEKNDRKLLKATRRKETLPSSEEDLQDLSCLFTRMYQDLFTEEKH